MLSPVNGLFRVRTKFHDTFFNLTMIFSFNNEIAPRDRNPELAYVADSHSHSDPNFRH